ncbi:hypothetical protein KQ229_02640 [Lactobacillus helveticus]|jgi:hypothetical protein|uniref:Conserved protein n=5 Tax=Lactobacillus helveticus TaxID=1587 RepID=U4QMU5_LACHE|nr:hypothetical protein [Lactobacillus helveticus]EGF36223.1 hypothetical protein AAULH_00803 [Lactobacillus helveticus MTCC 5463]ABX26404.1 hypothetical protein lhv_0139 [Lactobacillus helveticus DPC 4571]ADX69378.1 Conserved protein [Lactobacillus helveticus H10]AGQ22750.1 hypothetical protein lhe_0149 [Lactobacillus helveticus CNRZ32]AHI11148.1 hypothetical protein LBH_0114 [Lactobacillus helveticus H9]
MVEGRRANLRRMGQEQASQYKRMMAFVIFLAAALTLITATFLNPIFMKKQIRTSYNQAVVVRQVNKNFDVLADVIDARDEDDANLLAQAQTQPIADHIIDYTLGIHWFKVNNLGLAQQILTDINQGIDKGSSSGAQVINNKLKKQGANAPYAIVKAFDLNIVTLGANIASLLLIVNVIIVIVTIITLISLINDMRSKASTRMLIHNATAAGMWAGFWLILISGLLALVPVIFDVDNIEFGSILEIGSSVFLEYVIVGAIIYVICAIPWQATSTK